MNKKVILAISTVVFCSYFSTAEAAKHQHHGKTSKHAHNNHHQAKLAKHHHGKLHHFAKHGKSHSVASIKNQHLGTASWYNSKFHGRRTASGERYDMYAMTAAHNTLPMFSYAEITNLENNRRVIVRINDRGPYHSRRILDLSYAAAKELGINATGTGVVKITPLNNNLAANN